MNELNNYQHNLVDLPDEIVYQIFNKLNMIDVFYSFMDVNRRFHQLVFDSLYVRRLNLTTNIDNNASCEQISSIGTQAVSRISHQVEQLLVEQDSINQVLSVCYPRLYSLSLINFEEEIPHQYLTGTVLHSIQNFNSNV